VYRSCLRAFPAPVPAPPRQLLSSAPPQGAVSPGTGTAARPGPGGSRSKGGRGPHLAYPRDSPSGSKGRSALHKGCQRGHSMPSVPEDSQQGSEGQSLQVTACAPADSSEGSALREVPPWVHTGQSGALRRGRGEGGRPPLPRAPCIPRKHLKPSQLPLREPPCHSPTSPWWPGHTLGGHVGPHVGGPDSLGRYHSLGVPGRPCPCCACACRQGPALWSRYARSLVSPCGLGGGSGCPGSHGAHGTAPLAAPLGSLGGPAALGTPLLGSQGGAALLSTLVGSTGVPPALGTPLGSQDGAPALGTVLGSRGVPLALVTPQGSQSGPAALGTASAPGSTCAQWSAAVRGASGAVGSPAYAGPRRGRAAACKLEAEDAAHLWLPWQGGEAQLRSCKSTGRWGGEAEMHDDRFWEEEAGGRVGGGEGFPSGEERRTVQERWKAAGKRRGRPAVREEGEPGLSQRSCSAIRGPVEEGSGSDTWSPRVSAAAARGTTAHSTASGGVPVDPGGLPAPTGQPGPSVSRAPGTGLPLVV